MDKKKIGLIAIVLFLIIGLGSFVFANPDSEENFEKGDIEEREGSDRTESNSNNNNSSTDTNVLTETDETAETSDNTLTPANNNNYRNTNVLTNNEGTGNTSGNTPTVPVIVDTYAEALEAVIKAESSLTQGDVDYATNLVGNVANQSQKDELTNRLEAVQDIIDVTALIERLEEMVANSTNRDGIVDSIDYRDDENIEELVTNLTNGAAKDILVDRLEAVNKILNDNEGPVISGIINDSFTKDDVSLTISDDNEVTTKVILNGKEVEYIDTFTEEGTYVVTVVDEAFYETTWTFTIDRTAPVVGGVEDGKYYNTDVAVTIDDTNPGTVHLHKNGELVKPYNAGDPITEEGTYTVVVTDKAGNKSKEITFVIDKHVEEPKWVYILNLSDENNRKTIRNGQTLRVEVNFDEELTELPVLTIGNSQSVTFKKCNETDYGKYVCVADITIDNSVANLEDGKEIPFTVTNIIDKAGNPITLDNDDVTNTKNYGQVTYDGTAPIIRSLGVTDINEFKDEVGKLYAKNGDTVRVLVYFDEKLGVEPTVKLGGKEFTATYRDQSSRPEDNHYAYYADIKLTEDMNLNDGILPFEVYGYADKIGNVGVNLMENDVNMSAYPSVTIDNTLPVLNFNNGFITSGYTVEATDDNFAYMTVQYYDGRETETIEGNTFTLDKAGDNTRYNIKAYDKAGNVSKYRDIYLDTVNPVVSGTAINGGEEVSVENNGTYQEVTLNISDGSLKKVSLVKEDSTEEVLETYKDNYKNTKLTFEKKYTEEGTYTIKAVDRNNNESTITFTIDKTPASRVYSTLDFDKSGKQYYEIDKEKVYYVKNGDSFVFRMQFSEELKTTPIVKVGGMEVPMTLNEKFLNNEGKYIYEGTVNITEDSKLDQGRLEIVLSNVIDKAGNESTDKVVLNQTPTSNGRVAVYDVTSPGPTILGITGFFNETEDAHYIAYGQKVRVLTYYKEKLSVNPIVKIGNKEFETYYTEDSSDFENGVYAYYADIAITEDLGLNEGEIPFTVYGHKDLAGNEGRAYTNADITYNENDKYENRYNKVILDNSNPVFTTVMNGHQYNKDTEIKVDDLSLKSIEVYYYENNTTKTVENGYVLKEEGTYRITATDYIGRSTVVYVEIDKTAPSITGFEDNSYNNKNEKVYVKDENLYKVTINGKEYEHDGKYFEDKFTKEGTYTVVATDKAGNSTTKTVTIDKTIPTATITYSTVEPTTSGVIVTLTVSEEVEVVDAGLWNPNEGYATVFRKSYPENNKQTVTIVDRAGNKNTVEVVINNINK